jgi:hypothetical protein
MKPYGSKPRDFRDYGRNASGGSTGHWRGWESCQYSPRSGRGSGGTRRAKTALGRSRARAEAKADAARFNSDEADL